MKNLSRSEFESILKNSLNENLPGKTAHGQMNPDRNLAIDKNIFKRAAVMIILYKHDNCWKFPLIRRAEDEYAHSGQIALPGGKIEPNEAPSEAACREAEEEIGVTIDKINIIGQLSPITIPVSGFLVDPFICAIDFQPKWMPNPAEVDYVITPSLDELHDPVNKRVEQRVFNHKSVEIKYFNLQGQKVWGATAMMLNELRLVTKFLL